MLNVLRNAQCPSECSMSFGMLNVLRKVQMSFGKFRYPSESSDVINNTQTVLQNAAARQEGCGKASLLYANHGQRLSPRLDDARWRFLRDRSCNSRPIVSCWAISKMSSSKFRANRIRRYVPMATDGVPFSTRITVSSEQPARSAICAMLISRRKRAKRICSPKRCAGYHQWH